MKRQKEITEFFEHHPDQKLFLSYLYLKQGKVLSAKETNDAIIEQSGDTPLGARAKLNNFYIALYNANDPATAEALLSEVINEGSLSTEIEISLAQEALVAYVDPGTGIKSLADEQRIYAKPASAKKETGNDLLANYPNPFNPVTSIRYKIAGDQHVTLKIYDMLGRHVATLVDGFVSAGEHSATFNASRLASGMYIYQLQAGNFKAVKKMLLTK